MYTEIVIKNEAKSEKNDQVATLHLLDIWLDIYVHF